MRVDVPVALAAVDSAASGVVKRAKAKADEPLPSEAEVKKALKKAQQAKIPWCVLAALRMSTHTGMPAR